MTTEKNHAGEFLLSQSNGDRTFETVTLAAGNDLVAGTVLGVITAGGNYAQYVDGNIDGTETAVAVLYDSVDTSVTGTNAATKVLVVARDATVSRDVMTGIDAAGETDLITQGIITR